MRATTIFTVTAAFLAPSALACLEYSAVLKGLDTKSEEPTKATLSVNFRDNEVRCVKNNIKSTSDNEWIVDCEKQTGRGDLILVVTERGARVDYRYQNPPASGGNGNEFNYGFAPKTSDNGVTWTAKLFEADC